MLQAAEDKEDLIDVLQVVVIQDQSFKAGQWFEELLLQGLEMIEADTQLPEIWQIVKSVSKIQNLSEFWQCLSVKIAHLSMCEMTLWDKLRCLRCGSSKITTFRKPFMSKFAVATNLKSSVWQHV